MKILLEKTDERHPMTVAQIIEELSHYDILAERKSIYSDIQSLMDFGLDIVSIRGRSNQYFVASRDFEVAELRLLVDAILSSKFISRRKSRMIIKKLEKLVSAYDAKRLHNYLMVDHQVKTPNESILYNIDSIHEAIKDNKKIRFKYFDYTVDKTIAYRRNGDWYEVSPYALTWAEDQYYMIAYYKQYDSVSNFRVDRMNNIEMIEERRHIVKGAKAFNVAEYKKKNFRMYGGDVIGVTLQFDNALVNSVLDRFGEEVILQKVDERSFRVHVEVVTSHTFYSWLFMFGNKVKIVSPERVADEMKQMISEVRSMYEID